VHIGERGGHTQITSITLEAHTHRKKRHALATTTDKTKGGIHAGKRDAFTEGHWHYMQDSRCISFVGRCDFTRQSGGHSKQRFVNIKEHTHNANTGRTLRTLQTQRKITHTANKGRTLRTLQTQRNITHTANTTQHYAHCKHRQNMAARVNARPEWG